jgi:hypothetical protein
LGPISDKITPGERMFKFALYLLPLALCMSALHAAAPTIRRADHVAASAPAQPTGQAGLLPTALNLAVGVMALQAEMQALDARCVVTQSEVDWVNTMIRRWTEAGGVPPEGEMVVGIRHCGGENMRFRDHITTSRGGRARGNDALCFERFGENDGASSSGMIWYGAPRASRHCICKNNVNASCPGSCTVDQQEWFSNAFHIFQLIDFSDADFLAGETNHLAPMRRKFSDCARLTEDRRNLVLGFALDTAGSLGQPQNPATTMQAVGTLMQSGAAGQSGTAQMVTSLATIPLMMMAPEMGAQMMGAPPR